MTHFRHVIGAAIATFLAPAGLAQTSPAQRQLPTMNAPIKPATKIEVKKPAAPVQAPAKRNSTVAPTRQTAKANTTIANTAKIRPAIRVYARTSPTSRYNFVHYVVPNIAETPASELIVERSGVCGWTTSSFDGSRAPEADNRENCAELFGIYSDAVARLAESPPANQHYYELRIAKRSSLWARLFNSGFFDQPVMVVAEGPGRRVTRYKLQTLAAVPRDDQTAVKVDRDRDGFAPVSAGGLDCDDNDASRYPGGIEIPNDRDEDCDPYTIGTLDRDGDGFTDWNVSNPAFLNRRRPLTGGDCDDSNSTVHPNAPEVPTDGIDNNCDGDVDRVVN